MNKQWHEGTIGIPYNETGMKVAHYWVKAQKKATVHGINEGKITVLRIKIDGQVVADYDEDEWRVYPAEDDQQANIALYICLNEFN